MQPEYFVRFLKIKDFVRYFLVKTGGRSRDVSRWSQATNCPLLVTMVATFKKRLEGKMMASCPRRCFSRFVI